MLVQNRVWVAHRSQVELERHVQAAAFPCQKGERLEQKGVVFLVGHGEPGHTLLKGCLRLLTIAPAQREPLDANVYKPAVHPGKIHKPFGHGLQVILVGADGHAGDCLLYTSDAADE